jgi:hypothetical protein
MVVLLLVGELFGPKGVDPLVPIRSEGIKRHTGDVQRWTDFAIKALAAKGVIVGSAVVDTAVYRKMLY